MEPKQISGLQSPYPYARYRSFFAQNLESYTHVLRGRRIRACFHGWLIMSNHPDSVLWSLWNPTTSKFIRLPTLIHKERRGPYECCLSSPPGDQGSVFLLCTEETRTIVFCRADHKRKRLKWTEMSYAKQLKSITGVDDCFLGCPTCCNGKVYAMAMCCNYKFVIHVDMVIRGKEVVITLLPFGEVPHNHLAFNRFPSRNDFRIYPFLKGSDTELFCIKVLCCKDEPSRIVEVYLFKLDMTSRRWKEMMDLKDATFLLEFGTTSKSHSIFYKSLVAPETRGYVHVLGEGDNIIYSFHVKHRTMSLSSMPPCVVRENHVLVWAMLECSSRLLQVDNLEQHTQEEEHNDILIADNREFDTSESHLLNIPFHILEMIMKHCVGVEYLKFRATCKRCKLAAPSVQWRKNITSRGLQTYSLLTPWLMVLNNNHGIITLVDPIHGDKYLIRTPQRLKRGYQIFCSKHGWLLMCKTRPEFRGLKLVFFNPFTSNILKLPTIPFCVESLCFSAPPTSPDCMVVGFTPKGSWNVYIHFVYQEPTWHMYRLDFGTNDPYSFHLPTFNGREVYALCENNEKIEAFRDMSEEGYSREVVVDKAPTSCCKSLKGYFFSKCDQHLLLVIVGEFGESVEAFKLNDCTKEWEKMDCLGNHMIYMSDASCICLEAKSPEMGNKIYFPRSLCKNGDPKIVFYSLETCRYHMFHDGKNTQQNFGVDLFNTKGYYYPHTWIEPSWS